MSRFAEIKTALQDIPELPNPVGRDYGDAAVADLQWAVGEIERLREIMHTASETIKSCGHRDACGCRWCDMRRLFAAKAAGVTDANPTV
jgi:hypothetical protein